MRINPGRLASTLLFLPVIGLMLTASVANGQTNSGASEQDTVATVTNTERKNAAANAPVFTGYRGISIGMNAEEVRSTLNNLKKDKALDVFVFSEKESAQIYYDDKGTVTAISIDYFGGDSNAPSPATVLGAELQAKPDGSMYDLKRYPEAGYWVSYNRTAGDKPIVTITMQKM
ncbi:MAG TPA: hypothetical protein VFY67_13060 [Pyrinomonadaceae bacterium]|nr:hypothetical protein [Pyrinomonadaceae bacterium]